MNTDLKRSEMASLRFPKKDSASPLGPALAEDDTQRRCNACESVWPAEGLSCLACGEKLPTIRQFTCDETIISLGNAIRLSWQVEDADLLWMDHNQEVLPLFGQEDVYPQQSCTYTLVAQSAAGEVRQDISLTLPAPTIAHFSVDQREIDLHYPVIFSWEATNAETLFIGPSVGEVSGLSFCEAMLSKPGVYELHARNASGEAKAKVFLSLPKPEIGLFQALQDHVEPGEAHVLHWEATNADNLVIFPGELDVTGLTQIEVFPDRATTYRLVATNAAGSIEESTFLPMPAPEIKVFTSPRPISTEGEPVILQWDVKYAYRVELDPSFGEVAVSGEVKYRPKKAFTEFRLRAIGHSGVRTALLTVSRFPFPIDNLDEKKLLREMHQNLMRQEKMLKSQPEEMAAARFLPNKKEVISPISEVEELQRGSLTKELKQFFRKLTQRP